MRGRRPRPHAPRPTAAASHASPSTGAAGGQVVAAILEDPADTTEVSLIYANKTENDILTRDMLDKLAAEHPSRFHLHYTLDDPPKVSACLGFTICKMLQNSTDSH